MTIERDHIGQAYIDGYQDGLRATAPWTELRAWLRDQSDAADRAATFPGEAFPQWHQGARHMADGTLTQMGEIEAASRTSGPKLEVERLAWAVFLVATANMGVDPDRPTIRPDEDSTAYAQAIAREYVALDGQEV